MYYLALQNALERLRWEQTPIEVSSGSFMFLICCLVLLGIVSPVLKHHFHSCDGRLTRASSVVSNWCMQLSKKCDPYNLQLQSALDIDYRKEDLIIDALVLILHMNV